MLYIILFLWLPYSRSAYFKEIVVWVRSQTSSNYHIGRYNNKSSLNMNTRYTAMVLYWCAGTLARNIRRCTNAILKYKQILKHDGASSKYSLAVLSVPLTEEERQYCRTRRRRVVQVGAVINSEHEPMCRRYHAGKYLQQRWRVPILVWLRWNICVN